MKTIVTAFLILVTCWAALTGLSAYKGIQQELWSDPKGKWEDLQCDRKDCERQYKHRNNTIDSALKNNENTKNIEPFKPMSSSFMFELAIIIPSITLSSVFLLVLAGYRHKLKPEFAKVLLKRTTAFSLLIFTIELIRYYFSSYVGKEKDLFTWTSWCIASRDLIALSYLGDYFVYFIFSIPIVSIWMLTQNNYMPCLDVQNIDGFCGIKNYVFFLKRTMYLIYCMVVVVCFFWIQYIEVEGDAGFIYMLQPVAYSLLTAFFMAKISFQAVRIRTRYQCLRAEHIRHLEHDAGMSEGSLQWSQFAASNFPSDPTDPILGTTGLEYLRGFVIATIGPAVGIIIFLLTN